MEGSIHQYGDGPGISRDGCRLIPDGYYIYIHKLNIENGQYSRPKSGFMIDRPGSNIRRERLPAGGRRRPRNESKQQTVTGSADEEIRNNDIITIKKYKLALV